MLSSRASSVAVGECAAQPASARRSAIKYNETVLRADASICNVQRNLAETIAVRSTQSLERIASCSDCAKVDQTRAKASKLQRT